MSTAPITADATCGPMSPLTGVECENLTRFAHYSPASAEALALDDEKKSNGPVEWLSRIDRSLREPNKVGTIVDLARGLSLLRLSPDWDAFLHFVALDAKSASDARRSQGRLRSLW